MNPLKHEIGKYMTKVPEDLKAEESLQPYKGFTRRSFLKALGFSAGLAATDFGKLMEAVAGEGVSVYIDNFEVAGNIRQEQYYNVERQIPTKLATILRSNGVKVITRQDKRNDNTVVIRGVFSVRENDPQMRTGYQNLPFDSIELNIQYEIDGSLSGGKTYKMDARKFPDPMLDVVGVDVTSYLMRLQDEKQTPDVIRVNIDGKDRTLVKCKIDNQTKKYIDENNKPVIDSLIRTGHRLIGKELYWIKD